jgi:hypothetical protein
LRVVLLAATFFTTIPEDLMEIDWTPGEARTPREAEIRAVMAAEVQDLLEMGCPLKTMVKRLVRANAQLQERVERI